MRELSHPITPGMQVYPGDPAVDIEPAPVLAHDGVDVALLHLGSHTGTHLDAHRTASRAVARRAQSGWTNSSRTHSSYTSTR